MNELFKKGEVQKTYWAIVKNRPDPDHGTLKDYLIKDERKNKSRVCEQKVKGSKLAELNYRLIASSDNYHLLEVRPKTGRHHQIRVQLSHIGSAIKGDLKYGFARSNTNASISLHAKNATFIHPVKMEKISIEAPVPNDALWLAFYKLARS